MRDDPLTSLVAPVDPRLSWDMPPPGRMEVVADLDDLTTRVLAPNPSAMTLDGTNTYLVGMPGSGEVVIVDPGPTDDRHAAAVDAALRRRDATCALILVTHHHVDHAEAALPWAARYRCSVAARRRDVAGPDGRLLDDGETVAAAGVRMSVVSTPGHCSDHLAFRLPTGSLLTGDHVLGRGTSVVAHPDGDLGAYLDSLRRLLHLGADALYPGHGPVLREDPEAVVRYYLDHRAFREDQILAVVSRGPAEPEELVRRIYADVPTMLWPAAGASTRAALDKLHAEGRLRWDGRTARAVES